MVHSHREGTQKPRRERLPWVFGPQMPASPLGTVWLRGTWHSQGGKAAMLPKNPALPWLYTGSGEPGQGESLPSHAASVSPDVEGTRQPTRDRGKAILDPPSPRGGGVGAQGVPSHAWGLQPGPACMHSAAGNGVTRLTPPGVTLAEGTPQPQRGWGRDPNPPRVVRRDQSQVVFSIPRGGCSSLPPPKGDPKPHFLFICIAGEGRAGRAASSPRDMECAWGEWEPAGGF